MENVLCCCCCRYSKERPKFWSRFKPKEKYSENSGTISDATAHNELLSQKEFLETGDHGKRLLHSPSPPQQTERGISFIQIETNDAKTPPAPVRTIERFVPVTYTCIHVAGAWFFTAETVDSQVWREEMSASVVVHLHRLRSCLVCGWNFLLYDCRCCWSVRSRKVQRVALLVLCVCCRIHLHFATD